MDNINPRTLKTVFENSISKFASNPAVAFVGDEPITYGQFGSMVKALREALKKRGVKKGDKVAILSENSPHWGITYFAVGTMGAINVPILPDFHKSEVHHIVRNSGAKIVFVSSKLEHKLLDADFPDLELVVSLDDKPLTVDKWPWELFSDLIEGKEPKNKPKKVDESEAEIQEDDLLEILYTSGTTGHSKGVMLTHRNIVSNAISATKAIDVSSADRLVSILPLAHSYECTCGLILPLTVGASITYIKGLPTAQTLLPAVDKVKPTIILSVPLIMDKIYKKRVLSQINEKAVTRALYKFPPTRKLLHKIAGKKLYQAFGGKLRFIVFGGAATPVDVEDFLTEGGFPYITGYGLTESSPILTVNPVGQVKKQSAGKVVAEVKLRIDDPDPETGVGEIVATGPNIMKGYYRNEEATKKTFTEDGWLKTGDKGYIDDDGYLFIKGRSKNLILGPSGENIFPEEIEFHLTQNPYVLEALVYEKDGRIVARVHLDYDALDKKFSSDGIDESEVQKKIQELLEEIRKDTNSKIASYARIHRIIEQPEEFEKTPTKKIKRYLYTE